MSEPKTTAIFVRLTKDFPVGVSHTRGGVTLGAGPRPVAVEVTDEQLAALEGDRYVEICSDEEAQKWEDRLGEAPLPTSSENATDDDEEGNGRNYGGDGSQGGSNGDDDEEESEPETAEQLVDGNTRDALVELAKSEEVADLDFDQKQVTTKRVIAEAIVAKREANSSDEE